MTIKSRLQRLEAKYPRQTPTPEGVFRQMTNRELLQTITGEIPPELQRRIIAAQRPQHANEAAERLLHEWKLDPEKYKHTVDYGRQLLETLSDEILDSHCSIPDMPSLTSKLYQKVTV